MASCIVLSGRALGFFQEWYLSPRSLVLARRQLWWHCRQKVACEALPNGYKDEERMRIHRPDLQPDWMKDDMGPTGIEKDWASAWRNRVEHCVETELTEESDRLNAPSVKSFSCPPSFNENFRRVRA